MTSLALVMVGLPARGKTYMARKIARWLRWLGHDARVFNVGAYRRERLGAGQSADFFDPDNEAGTRAREQMAVAALDDVAAWFRSAASAPAEAPIGWVPGDASLRVAVYDATNSTRARRAQVARRLEAAGAQVVFVESVCTDPALIEQNVRDNKLASPDYKGMDAEAAVADFRRRIALYERAYETLAGDEGHAFIKVIDVGLEIVAHRIQGYLPGRLVGFLMNLHTAPRPILLTRHGQSEHNRFGRIGGDSGLSEAGKRYADSLAGFLTYEFGDELPRLVAWSSQLRRAVETGEHLPVPVRSWRVLDEIDAGSYDGMTYQQIKERHPEEYEARRTDKLRYRYPLGESYEDVIARVEPAILEIERTRAPVLVIAHQAVLRALYAYLVEHPRVAVPRLPIPLHTVIVLTPRAYGVDERRIELPPGPLEPELVR